MTQVSIAAEAMYDAECALAQFKADNAHVFKELGAMRKRVSAAKKELVAAMNEAGTETYRVQDRVYTCTQKPTMKHDLSVLEEVLDVSREDIDNYVSQVSQQTSRLSSKRQRASKDSDA